MYVGYPDLSSSLAPVPSLPASACVHSWSRVLLLQQMLVDAIDLLDPDYVRVPESRRLRLMPVTYGPLPNVSPAAATPPDANLQHKLRSAPIVVRHCISSTAVILCQLLVWPPFC
jgi:hypothetical protein